MSYFTAIIEGAFEGAKWAATLWFTQNLAIPVVTSVFTGYMVGNLMEFAALRRQLPDKLRRCFRSAYWFPEVDDGLTEEERLGHNQWGVHQWIDDLADEYSALGHQRMAKVLSEHAPELHRKLSAALWEAVEEQEQRPKQKLTDLYRKRAGKLFHDFFHEHPEIFSTRPDWMTICELRWTRQKLRKCREGFRRMFAKV